MKIKNNIERYLIREDATILDAMRAIDNGEERTCFVVGEERALLRVVTDGDIRRAVLGGASLDSPVLGIHDRKPTTVRVDQPVEEARRLLSKRITVVPVVDAENRIHGMMRLHDAETFVNIKSRDVTILGMGYVGLTLGLVLAENGFTVTGYDVNQPLLDDLNAKIPPFHERGLTSQLYKHSGNSLRFTSELDKARADIYIITVGTPIIKETMEPNLDYIRKAAETIGSVLKTNDMVVLRSTVPLGATRDVVLPELERASGLKAGEDFSLAFCPERTAEGKALEELKKNPQIVGGLDAKSTELASLLFSENTCTIIDAGSIEGAEMCKLLDNTYRDVIFGYANQMALLCEKTGLDLGDLIDKVNLGYKRNFIPKPSPGVGGACLSKDPYILLTNFRAHGLDGPITRAAREINELAPATICDRSEALLQGCGKSLAAARILVIGFAFKGEPETSDLRDSTTLWFLEELKRRGAKAIQGYDPIVSDEAIAALDVTPCSLEDGFAGADAVFIMNNHRSYGDLKIFRLLETACNPVLFYDGWGVYKPSDIRSVKGVIYAGTGVG